MNLKVGDKAPDFALLARKQGRDCEVRLSELLGQKNLVLYFYPKDFTAACTAEACGFRDMYGELQGDDTEVVGVSADGADSHDRFAKEYGIAFALVSDPRRELARKYGATSSIRDVMGTTARVTFVIDKAGQISGIFDSAIWARQHLVGVKAVLAGIRRRAGVV